jgi:hypothetical protein
LRSALTTVARRLDSETSAQDGHRGGARDRLHSSDSAGSTGAGPAERGVAAAKHRRRLCVWADANYQGTRASFPSCTRNRPKTYRLSDYLLPPRHDGWLTGVTSWRNNMGRGYSAQFLDMQHLPLHRVNRGGGGHMPPDKNDEAALVDRLCVP